jgi:hypothetical protein
MINIWQGAALPTAGRHALFPTFRLCFVSWFLDGLSIIVVIQLTRLSGPLILNGPGDMFGGTRYRYIFSIRITITLLRHESIDESVIQITIDSFYFLAILYICSTETLISLSIFPSRRARKEKGLRIHALKIPSNGVKVIDYAII